MQKLRQLRQLLISLRCVSALFRWRWWCATDFLGINIILQLVVLHCTLQSVELDTLRFADVRELKNYFTFLMDTERKKQKLLNWISNSTDMSLFNFPDTFVYFLFVWKTKIFFLRFTLSAMAVFNICIHREHFVSSTHRAHIAYEAQPRELWAELRVCKYTRVQGEHEKRSSFFFRRSEKVERRNYWENLLCVEIPMIWMLDGQRRGWMGVW